MNTHVLMREKCSHGVLLCFLLLFLAYEAAAFLSMSLVWFGFILYEKWCKSVI